MARAPRRQGKGPVVHIHAAGSWLRETTGEAGYGAVVRYRGRVKAVRLCGHLSPGGETSNIRAEMVAAAEALESLPDGCTVTLWVPTDFMARAIRYDYNRNANLDIWERLDRQFARHTLKRFRHEPLYYGKPDMVEAHKLASMAACGADAAEAVRP